MLQEAQYPLTVSKARCLGKGARYGKQILMSTTVQASKHFWLEDFLSQTGHLCIWWLATNFFPVYYSNFCFSPQHLQCHSARDSTGLPLFAWRFFFCCYSSHLVTIFSFLHHWNRDLCYKHDNHYALVVSFLGRSAFLYFVVCCPKPIRLLVLALSFTVLANSPSSALLLTPSPFSSCHLQICSRAKSKHSSLQSSAGILSS